MNDDLDVKKAVDIALNSNKSYADAVNEGFMYLLNTFCDSQVKKKSWKNVYVLEMDSGLVKIGISSKPNTRFATIETSSGCSVINKYISPPCANARDLEKDAHRYFKNHRKKGEFFQCSFSEAVEFITKIQNNDSNKEVDSI